MVSIVPIEIVSTICEYFVRLRDIAHALLVCKSLTSSYVYTKPYGTLLRARRWRHIHQFVRSMEFKRNSGDDGLELHLHVRGDSTVLYFIIMNETTSTFNVTTLHEEQIVIEENVYINGNFVQDIESCFYTALNREHESASMIAYEMQMCSMFTLKTSMICHILEYLREPEDMLSVASTNAYMLYAMKSTNIWECTHDKYHEKILKYIRRLFI